MSHVPMVFQFRDLQSASLAFDTLTEVGYHVHRGEQGGRPVVQVFVDHSELTSALEIAQAHGGDLVAEEETVSGIHDHPAAAASLAAGAGAGTGTGTAENQLYETAYGMDMVPIPAHLVNEDGDADKPVSDFDPSGDDYDGFEAGVHL